MKKLKFYILANIVLVAIWLVASKTDNLGYGYDINMTISTEVSETMVDEVKAAIEVFPDSVVKDFVEQDWKLVLLTDFEQLEGYEHIGSDSSVVGLINFADKTITVKGVPKYKDTAKKIMVHELCHYVDRLWDNESSTGSFQDLFELYKEGRYITYAYAGVTVTEEYAQDIGYATSSNKEFFAESFKDYLLHPEYLEQNYPEIYDYYRLLLIKKGW